MTNKEAIEWINYHINTTYYEETDELLKALKKAIKALEKQDTKKNSGLISLPSKTMLIPVDEELPEYDKYVLMFYSQDKMEIGYYHYDSTFYPTEYADLNETGWYTKEGDT